MGKEFYLCNICGKAYSTSQAAEMCQHASLSTDIPIQNWCNTIGLMPVGCRSRVSTAILQDEPISANCSFNIELNDGTTIQNVSSKSLCRILNKSAIQIDGITINLE